MLALGGESACQFVNILFQRERVFDIEWLAGDNRLEGVVEPLSERMNEACTVRANRASTEWKLVDFYCEVKISKGVVAVFLDPVAKYIQWSLW